MIYNPRAVLVVLFHPPAIDMPRLDVCVCSVFLFFVCLTAPRAVAVPSANQDIWRVDLRPVTQLTANEQNFMRLKYYRWANNRWHPSDAETFFGTQQADIPLILFALGYSLTTQATTEVGHAIVRHFDPSKPCRIVYWDWYSDMETIKIRRDLREKIPVADTAADYLGYFLQKLKPQSKACLFGFSFGCRIINQAAEVLRRSGQRPEGLRLHLVIAGSATDQDWFSAGQLHGNVPEITDKILITHNPDDLSLKFYPFLYPRRNRTATALGVHGVPIWSVVPEFRDRFENVNVGRYVGRKHETLGHVGSAAFQRRINTYFFFE